METRSITEQVVKLGNRLREERELSEISIARAAAQLGIPTEMIESMEKENPHPAYLNWNFWQIFTGFHS